MSAEYGTAPVRGTVTLRLDADEFVAEFDGTSIARKPTFAGAARAAMQEVSCTGMSWDYTATLGCLTWREVPSTHLGQFGSERRIFDVRWES